MQVNDQDEVVMEALQAQVNQLQGLIQQQAGQLVQAQAAAAQAALDAQAAVQAQQQAAAAPPAVPPPMPVLPPPVPMIFALSPAQVDNTPINYNTSSGAKLYKQAIAPLDIKYDCTPQHLKTFVALMSDRARDQGWTNRILIINTVGHPNANLMDKYGQISLTDILVNAQAYVGTQTRAAQDASNMYTCILASLSEAAVARVLLEKEKYTVNATPNGPLLFKVIIGIANIDTNATVRNIRGQLSSLDKYMDKCNDVEKFNEHVKDLLDSLTARGESTNDLLSNLFKGYASADDKEFKLYVKRKQEEYDEGSNITTSGLMTLALNKYKIIKDSGEWAKPNEDQERIYALEATVRKLKSGDGGKPKGKPTTGNKSGSKDVGNSEAGKRKPSPSGGNAIPEWMKVPPKEGQKHAKVHDGKEYYWCPKHTRWVRHKPEDCKGVGYNPKDPASKKAKPDSGSKLAKAYATIKQEAGDKDGDAYEG